MSYSLSSPPPSRPGFGSPPHPARPVSCDIGHTETIELSDDEEVAAVDDIIRRRNLAQKRLMLPRAQVVVIPDEEDDVIEVEDEVERAVMIDLTSDDEARHRHRGVSAPMRNPPLREPEFAVPQYCHSGLVLKPGMTIELPETIGRRRVHFLRIEMIVENRTTQAVTLRGFGYTRTRHLRGLLIKKTNEVCRVLEIDEDDARPPTEQALMEIGLETDMPLVKRNLNETNAQYPKYRFEPGYCDSREEIEERELLVCRWTLSLHYRDSTMRRLGKPLEWSLAHYLADGVPKRRFRVDDASRCQRWRDHTMPGDARRQRSPSVVALNPDHLGPSAADSKQYTSVDAFSGAGGCSCGQAKAGFNIIAAIDHWDKACRTYRLNFPNVPVLETDIADFIYHRTNNYRADVLHLSPPCQFWSPAHTVEGRNDDANIFALFSCQQLIEKVRPRLFTLEQTFGLLHGRFEEYFNALVQGFTSQDYSVRWKIVHLAGWGLPQKRKRLIMIGACPGEKLPPYPNPTHGDQQGLRSFVTVREALYKIHSGVDLHNPRAMKRINVAPWNPGQPLHRTITCSGGQNYHYNGRRDFTLREYACLQGFPTAFRFAEPCVKKQIGNAFPAVCVKVLYDHLRRWLEGVDGGPPQQPRIIPGLEDVPLPRPRAGPRVDVVVIDAEEEEAGDVVMRDVVCISDSESGSTVTLGRGEPRFLYARASPRREMAAILKRQVVDLTIV